MRTAVLMGHRASDQVLFDHYRALTTKEAAEAYFGLLPKTDAGPVVQFAVA
jgi:hypothetical protein